MKGKESLCERENIQKLSSKINYLVHRTAHQGECPSGRNLSKSFQNQTESARYAWKDSANRGQSSLLELLRCSLSYGKIVQTEGNQACLNC